MELPIDSAFLTKINARLNDLDHQLAAPAALANQNKYRELLREHARIKKIAEKAAALLKARQQQLDNQTLRADKSTDPEFLALVQAELEELEQTIPHLEKQLLLELLPPDPMENRNTIMEIRAGAGGQEAALFAGDLLRMYTHYAENRAWKVELIDASPSELGGYKEVVFGLTGENVYRTMQFEAGTHRVQRVPVTEACGRIHTSTVTVAVLPEAEDFDEIEINPADLKIDVYRASGAGGQHVNKTDSAVRITHLPTGIVVASQEERSQHKNRAKAMRVLKSHLLAMQRAEAARQIDSERRAQIGSGERSERIRTYNFPQNRLTDHRINFTSHNLHRIMEGELDDLLQALQEHYFSRQVQSGLNLDQIIERF